MAYTCKIVNCLHLPGPQILLCKYGFPVQLISHLKKNSPASSRLAVAVAGNPFDSLPLERVVAPPLHQ